MLSVILSYFFLQTVISRFPIIPQSTSFLNIISHIIISIIYISDFDISLCLIMCNLTTSILSIFYYFKTDQKFVLLLLILLVLSSDMENAFLIKYIIWNNE
ncbi:Transmembrane domain-containing protein [Orpheovirus IHUMI-LCC2]|uniref:Transmembrane domain-containing protein n=1 Tax=Orpheovirus IHUMI-LCC2 TaxID=2023057 RepID=A0A2I2L411_9VIRU|nr:Transmembrane domain-containing protein [Orpheovirus IHUMI-LCC2]SNW62250.1 Transmembrane domain-containing protein [Orpheovirus IHUMI-LCC2]